MTPLRTALAVCLLSASPALAGGIMMDLPNLTWPTTTTTTSTSDAACPAPVGAANPAACPR